MAASKSVPPPSANILDRLYDGPLAQFVALRRELAQALRAAGDPAASRQVAAATKPTRPAWALNQVTRRRPELLQGLFDARDRAVTAQKRGHADELRVATRDYRERLSEVVRAARDLAAQGGVPLSAVQSRGIGETLQALTAGDSEARARLVSGHLTRNVDVEDPFAGLEPGEKRPRRRPEPPPSGVAVSGPKREAERASAAERERVRAGRQNAIDEAHRQLALVERGARDARGRATEARAAARRAQSDADDADRRAAEAERQIDQARAALAQAKKR